MWGVGTAAIPSPPKVLYAAFAHAASDFGMTRGDHIAEPDSAGIGEACSSMPACISAVLDVLPRL